MSFKAILYQILACVAAVGGAIAASVTDFSMDPELQKHAVFVDFDAHTRDGRAVAVEELPEVKASGSNASQQAAAFALKPDVIEGRGGEGVFLLKFPEKRSIRLTLMSSKNLMVQKSITMPPGETVVKFQFSVLDDNLINLTREGWVRFLNQGNPIAWPRTTIHDDEKPPKMRIDCPTEVYEGGGNQDPSWILLDRPADVDFNIGFDFSPPNKIQSVRAFMKAGETAAKFRLQPIKDDKLTGDFKVKMTARGEGRASDLATAEKNLTFIDRAEFNLSVKLRSPVVENQFESGSVRIEGEYDRDIVVNLRSDHPEWLKVPDSVVLPAGDMGVNFSMDGMDASSHDELRTVTVTASAERFVDGSDSTQVVETKELGQFRLVDLVAKDLAWDPSRKLLYASVDSYSFPSSGEPITSGIVAINPETMEITPGVKILSPGQLLLSADGQSLYVNSAGSSVKRISLTDFTVRNSYVARYAPGRNRHSIMDFCLLNEDIGEVALAVAWTAPYFAAAGIEIHSENGITSPLVPTFSGQGGSERQDSPKCNVELSADPNVICFISERVKAKFRIASGVATEIQKVETYTSFPYGWEIYNSFRSNQSGDLISSSGLVIAEDTLFEIGIYAGGPPYSYASPDAYLNRTYFMSGNSIIACDNASYSVFHRVDLPSQRIAPPSRGSLVRWGVDGLAFASSNGVVLVNNQRLVPNDPSTNLEVKVIPPLSPLSAGMVGQFLVEVTNYGPSPAQNVAVNVRISSTARLVAAESPGWRLDLQANAAELSIGELPAGSKKASVFSATAATSGLINCLAGVASDAIEPDYADNRSSASVPVLFSSTATSNVFNLGECSMIADPDGERVWLSVPADFGRLLDNMVVLVDPTNGSILRILPLPWNPAPGVLAITRNGRFLFVGANEGNEVCRFDLSVDGGAPSRFRLESFSTLSGIQTLDETGYSVIGIGMKSDDDVRESIAVFDGSSMRADVVGYSKYFDRFYFADGKDLLYFVSGGYINAFTLGSTGFTRLYQVQESITSTGSYIVKDGLGIYADGSIYNLETGKRIRELALPNQYHYLLLDDRTGCILFINSSAVIVVDPNTWNVKGTFPMASVSNRGKVVRWGSDGLAVTAYGGIHFMRLPALLTANSAGQQMSAALSPPESRDLDDDGTPDAMEALFGNLATQADPNPVKSIVETKNGMRVIHLHFSRRVGMSPPTYVYEVSENLLQWSRASQVAESPGRRFTRNGWEMEDVDVAIPMGTTASGFVRIVHP